MLMHYSLDSVESNEKQSASILMTLSFGLIYSFLKQSYGDIRRDGAVISTEPRELNSKTLKQWCANFHEIEIFSYSIHTLLH